MKVLAFLSDLPAKLRRWGEIYCEWPSLVERVDAFERFAKSVNADLDLVFHPSCVGDWRQYGKDEKGNLTIVLNEGKPLAELRIRRDEP